MGEAVAVPGLGVSLDRRAVLGLAGAAAAALAAIPPSLARAATAAPVRYVVTDRRHPQSLQFGEALTGRGAIRLEITDGLTMLWQQVLSPHWRTRPGAVAGLTAPGAWHALAEQARGEARRSALIGRHLVASQDGSAEHVLTAPRPLLAAAVRPDAEGLWPTAMAALAASCTSAPGRCDGEWRSQAHLAPGASAHSLLTWIIA